MWQPTVVTDCLNTLDLRFFFLGTEYDHLLNAMLYSHQSVNTMAVVNRHNSKWCYFCDIIVARNNYDQHMEEHAGDWEKVTFSNNLTEVCKTKCKMCGRAYILPVMRVHTKSAHKITITQYKEQFNQQFLYIIEKIFHKCGICGKPVLFDSDSIAVHLKNRDNHNVTHKVYNDTFLTKICGTKQAKKMDELTVLKSPENKLPKVNMSKEAKIVEQVNGKNKLNAISTNNKQEILHDINNPLEYKDQVAEEHKASMDHDNLPGNIDTGDIDVPMIEDDSSVNSHHDDSSEAVIAR